MAQIMIAAIVWTCLKLLFLFQGYNMCILYLFQFILFRLINNLLFQIFVTVYVSSSVLITDFWRKELVISFDYYYYYIYYLKDLFILCVLWNLPTADLKWSLTAETKSWMVDFGHHCNRKYRMEIEQIFWFL